LLWCLFISSARPPFWSARRRHQRKPAAAVGVVVGAAVAAAVVVAVVGSEAAVSEVAGSVAVDSAAEAGAAVASVTVVMVTADMDATSAIAGAGTSARIIDRGLIGVIVTRDPKQKSGVSVDRHTFFVFGNGFVV
jgi:hypothetical protein